MYRAFAFEGDIHRTLACVPLCVRRKLDLAQRKISLEGWQALAYAERLALCHLPVESAEEVAVYRAVLEGFCQRIGVPLAPLDAGTPWRTYAIPELVRERLKTLSHRLDDRSWRLLDDEERFAITKMAEPKRAPWKLPAVLAELGLGPLENAKESAPGPCDVVSP